MQPCLGGDMLSARQTLDIGSVTRVVKDDELDLEATLDLEARLDHECYRDPETRQALCDFFESRK